MSNTISITPKGERLLSTKFGIPYGLILAYIDNLPLKVVFGISAILGFMIGFVSWKVIVVWLPFILLVGWAERHFKPTPTKAKVDK